MNKSKLHYSFKKPLKIIGREEADSSKLLTEPNVSVLNYSLNQMFMFKVSNTYDTNLYPN